MSHNLGRVERGEVVLNDGAVGHLQGVLSRGHVVANHTHRRCIHGLSCSGLGSGELSAAAARTEVETAHAILQASVAAAGQRERDRVLPFFRPPGSGEGYSYDPTVQSASSTARWSPRTWGPVGWQLPPRGQEDSGCCSRGTSVATCAHRYFAPVRSGDVRNGVILIHDNFDQAPELTRRVIAGLRACGMRIVHPACLAGCTR